MNAKGKKIAAGDHLPNPEMDISTLRLTLTTFFLVTDQIDQFVSKENLKHYKHLGVKVGSAVRTHRIRPYSTKEDFKKIYNVRLHEAGKSPETQEKDFLTDEISLMNGWLNNLLKNDPGNPHKNILRRYIEFLELREKSINPVENKNSDENISELQNNFDSVPIETVLDYFKKGLVDKRYLSLAELHSYLYHAFHIKKIPQEKFKLQGVQSKQKVRSLFGDYYRNLAGKPKGKQKEYAALLGEYFQGYTTENVSTNFS